MCFGGKEPTREHNESSRTSTPRNETHLIIALIVAANADFPFVMTRDEDEIGRREYEQGRHHVGCAKTDEGEAGQNHGPRPGQDGEPNAHCQHQSAQAQDL